MDGPLLGEHGIGTKTSKRRKLLGADRLGHAKFYVPGGEVPCLWLQDGDHGWQLVKWCGCERCVARCSVCSLACI